jgi:hypothetical protein
VAAEVIVDPGTRQRADQNQQRQHGPQQLGAENSRPPHDVDGLQFLDERVDPGPLQATMGSGEGPPRSVSRRAAVTSVRQRRIIHARGRAHRRLRSEIPPTATSPSPAPRLTKPQPTSQYGPTTGPSPSASPASRRRAATDALVASRGLLRPIRSGRRPAYPWRAAVDSDKQILDASQASSFKSGTNDQGGGRWFKPSIVHCPVSRGFVTWPREANALTWVGAVVAAQTGDVV